MLAKVATALILTFLLAAGATWKPDQAHSEGPQGCETVFASTTRGGGQRSGGGFSCNIFGESSEAVRVDAIIDGDTIDLAGGERVRFIGVDTPERGEPFYNEATKFTEDLLLGKKVRLVRDLSERDQVGRILRYVYVDDILVNAELIREGYAKSLEVSPNVTNAVCFAALEEEARDQHRGIWAPPTGE